MNIKSVLRTYSLLRQLSDDETALLETLRQLNESEREALVETLSPQPVRKSSAKKSASKKSLRASSLEQQIQKRPREAMTADSGWPCAHVYKDGLACSASADANVHHLPSAAGYHLFLEPASPAGDSSSANGGAGGGTRNLEVETESAAVAAGGSNE